MAGAGTVTTARMVHSQSFTYKRFKLSNVKVCQGTAASINSAGYASNPTASTCRTIGIFDETVDNSGGSAGDLSVNVRLPQEVTCYWLSNGTSGDAIAITDILKPCYWRDNQTVGITDSAGTYPMAGIIWDVDATKGVLVQLLPTNDQALEAPTITSFVHATHGHTNDAGGGVLAAPAITSFANATHTHENAAGGGAIRLATGATLSWTNATCTIATPGTGTHYKAPAAATQASAIVLGATGASRGDFVEITSAGAITQTITYYDLSSGTTVAKTTAMTASVGHHVRATFDGSEWIFSAYCEAN